jgi:hypothetical protein
MLIRNVKSTRLRTVLRFAPGSTLFPTLVYRFQSTDTVEKKEEEFEYKFPQVTLKLNEVFNEELYKKLPITLDAAKQLATEISEHIRTDQKVQSELDDISKLANNYPTIFEKFSKMLDVLRRARKIFVEKSGIKGKGQQMINGIDVEADTKLRTALGRWSRRDAELEKTLRDLYAYLANKVFSVNVEYNIPDARCIGIFIRAKDQARASVVYDPEIQKSALKSNMLPEQFTRALFENEFKLLKEEERELTKYKKKVTAIENEIDKFKNGGKVEDMLWQKNKEIWKKLTDLSSEENVEESEINARFPKRLSTPEGWVSYKFQAMDVVYRF